MNNKGFMYNIGLALVLLAILISAFVILEEKKGKFSGKIGEQQFEMVKAYQRGEDALLYVDQKAKIKLSDAIKTLASNGGFSGESECGKQSDNYLWSKKGAVPETADTCFPFKESPEELNEALFKTLKQTWASSSDDFAPKYSTNNLLQSKDGKITFAYKSPDARIIGFAPMGSLLTRSYLIYPSFKVSLPYSFKEYQTAKELAQKVIDECKLVIDVPRCVYTTKIGEEHFYDKDCNEVFKYSTNLDLNPLGIGNNIYPVCFKSKNLTLLGEPNIKFALYVPQKKPKLPLAGLFSLDGLFNIDSLFTLIPGLQEVQLINVLDPTKALDFTSYTKLIKGSIYSVKNYYPGITHNLGLNLIDSNGNNFKYLIETDTGDTKELELPKTQQ
jgi:hypothetical protein